MPERRALVTPETLTDLERPWVRRHTLEGR